MPCPRPAHHGFLAPLLGPALEPGLCYIQCKGLGGNEARSCQAELERREEAGCCVWDLGRSWGRKSLGKG